MSSRREAREYSLQMLYTLDNCNTSNDVVYEVFEKNLPKAETYKKFAIKLFEGVCTKKKIIDSLINQYTKNWKLERMAVVDRNIIRLAVYEIIDTPDIPIGVIIDEAIEISKKYSTRDSSKFINGILDKLKEIREQKNKKQF